MRDSTTPPAVTVLPVPGLPEIRRGDDLAALLARSVGPDGPCPARPGDVLCVSSKIVSKARGLVVPPMDKQDALDTATVRLVARRLHGTVTTSVVETVSGPVLAAAGIDASNSPDGLLLLPADPDAEAAQLGTALEAALGFRVGIVLTDTSSRIWRVGVSDIALGSWGVHALQDLRGERDDAGRTLGITVRALADSLAAAADLAKGKTSRCPIALVRGVADAVRDGDGPDGRALTRTGPGDWFRRPSLESVWQALGLALDEEPVALMDPEPDAERIERAVAVARVGCPGAPAPRVERDDQGPTSIVISCHTPDPEALIAAGALAERVRTALRAEEIAAPLAPWDVQVRVEEPA